MLSSRKKLTERVKLWKLKTELEKVRKTGDKTLISKKELAIAKKIQKIISSFDYEENTNHPSEMAKNSEINCVGAALLGGTLLEELNINYLAVDLPEHASTILITSNDKRYRQDFTPWNTNWKENYREITPEILENKKERVKIQDRKEGFLVFKNWNPYKHIKGQLIIYVTNPEKGVISTILYNEGVDLYNKKDFFKAKQANKQAIKSNSNKFFVHNNLGTNLSELWRNEKAIIAYQKAIELDPNEADPYYNLGEVFWKVGKYAEAIWAYQKFIQLADPEDKDWIEKAQEEMKKLQEKLDEKSE